MGELNELRVARVCYSIVFVDTDLSLDCIEEEEGKNDKTKTNHNKFT